MPLAVRRGNEPARSDEAGPRTWPGWPSVAWPRRPVSVWSRFHLPMPPGFVVANTNNSGAGSLRDAIDQANLNAGPDLITFDSNATGTIVLDSELFIYDDLIIDGPGASALAVSGNDVTRVFQLYSYHAAPAINVTIEGLTVADGNSGGGNGAGILAFHTNLTLDSVNVVDNATTEFGGGVSFVPYDNGNVLEIVNSVFSGNSAANGGGVAIGGDQIYDNTSVHIADTTINDNVASK